MAKTVWIDILTPKEVLYFGRLREMLLRDGFRVYVTAREYDCNIGLLRLKGIPHKVIGVHGGARLEEKLLTSLDRARGLATFISGMRHRVDWSVSLSSPEALRVSYGLGIRSIVSNDAPHAEAVCRLTIPLATFVVAPRCIGAKTLLRYGARRGGLIRYDGIDEVGWVRGFKPDPSAPRELGMHPGQYAVVRTEEAQAAYLLGLKLDPGRTLVAPTIRAILKKLHSYGVVVLPRYKEQREWLRKKFGYAITIPERAVDTLSLAYYSSLVVSGGATISREGALMGVPSICSFPLREPEVERFLISKGFPLWYLPDPEAAAAKAVKLVKAGQKYRRDVSRLVRTLVDPVQVIMKIIRSN